jgi:two-component system response regulator (stage 0 sporulation protein F)
MNAKKILCADDEMAIRLLVEETFKDEGFEVYCAKDGSEALDILEREKNINIVILDIKMERMDGIEELRQIKARSPDLPVILYTAYGEYKQDFATWHSDEYIVKSADLSELISAVKQHCPPPNIE